MAEQQPQITCQLPKYSQISQKSTNYCRKPGHQKEKLNYFCLDQWCSQSKLFCHLCARKFHKKHRIGRIDRLIEPLSLLNINSFHENSSQIYQQLKGKLQEFYDALSLLQSSFDSTLKQIQQTTIFQIKCILETFSNEKIQEIQNTFTLPTANQSQIKSAVSTINFLQFEGIEEGDTMKKVLQATLNKMSKITQKAHHKIEAIFTKMISLFKENDFNSELRRYKYQLQKDARKLFEENTNLPQECQTVFKNDTNMKHEKNNGVVSKKDEIPFGLYNKFNSYFEENDELLRKKSNNIKNVVIVKKQT